MDEQNEKQMAAAKAKRQRMQELEAQKKLEAPLDQGDLEEIRHRDTMASKVKKGILEKERKREKKEFFFMKGIIN